MPSRSTRGRSPKNRPEHGPDSRGLALGIDLGATKVVSGLVDPDGRIVHHSGRHLHANDGPDGVLDSMVRCARACLEQHEGPPSAIGAAVAAQVDPSTGVVIHAPNLGWRDYPLGDRLSELLGGPVAVVNDARAATYAEWKYGAGRGTEDLFCLALGTGIGGSAVLGGALIEGGAHAAGEVGHLTIVSGGRKCHCPNTGCFEAYVGGWAIGERAREAAAAEPAAGAALIQRAGSLERVTARTVFEMARAGDALAVRLAEETDRYLADGAVGVVNAFNPAVLVLGGGLVAGRPGFLEVVQGAVRTRCQPPAAAVRVVRARFQEDAAMIGAAQLAPSKPSAPR